MKRVTGIGGIFMKANGDAKKMEDWYAKQLGLEETPGNGYFWKWRKENMPDERGATIFSVFSPDTDYLNPSKAGFMINFRVDNLEALLVELHQEGVTQVGNMETYDYGKFAWILDPEGNKIELWEPLGGQAFPGGMDME
jgi:catechol 2,3-dioxygenase-like lactoylglutathione lyase family enzyme